MFVCFDALDVLGINKDALFDLIVLLELESARTERLDAYVSLDIHCARSVHLSERANALDCR